MALPSAWPAALACLFAIALSWVAFFTLGTSTFLPGACERLESYLHKQLVGQDIAVRQLVSAVCAHIDTPEPQKPLVISVHGPPGVGKTFTHLLMARALYNRDPEAVTQCPGMGCTGYKVVYGLDFPHADRLQQLEEVKEAILSHIRSVRDPLLVFEEYDKFDCVARAWLRLLISHASESGSLNRAIILLESNLGYTELEQMLSTVQGDISKVSAEDTERTLRDVVFAFWAAKQSTNTTTNTPINTHTSNSPDNTAANTAASTATASTATASAAAAGAATAASGGGGMQHIQNRCEDTYVDTLRFMSLVDFFLPYLPLQREHIEQLVSLALERERDRLWDRKHVKLTWTDRDVTWLASKVEFDGPYPLEGAKQVATVIIRYCSEQIRRAPDMRAHSKHQQAEDHTLQLKLPY